MKKFHIQFRVGKAKYVVSYHDGDKKHPDGSDFFDVAIFKNKKLLQKFVDQLSSDGYIETNW